MLLALLTISPVAYGQQNVWNVPSADVTDKGKVFFQHQSNFRTWHPDPYYSAGTNAAVGIGMNTELDVTLFNLNTDDVALGFGAKTAIPMFKDSLPERQLKWIVGEIVPVSFDSRGIGNWTYSEFSGVLPKLKTRLTAGGSYGSRQIFGRDTVHFVGAIEQPIGKHIQLIADWYSGNHSQAYFTPGISYLFNKDYSLSVGYQIPNHSDVGRSGVVVQLQGAF